jgi:hypothetical protein
MANQKVSTAAIEEAWLTIALRNMGKPKVIKIFFDCSIFDKGTNYDNDGKGPIRFMVIAIDNSPLIHAGFYNSSVEGNVTVKGKTDENGFFESGDLPIGFYTVQAAQTGYRERISQFQVFDNRDPSTKCICKEKKLCHTFRL